MNEPENPSSSVCDKCGGTGKVPPKLRDCSCPNLCAAMVGGVHPIEGVRCRARFYSGGKPAETRAVVGSVWRDPRGIEWTLLAREEGALPGWQCESATGKGDGFLADGSFAAQPLVHVRGPAPKPAPEPAPFVPRPMHSERKPWTCRCSKEHAADVEQCDRCKDGPPWPPKRFEDRWNAILEPAAPPLPGERTEARERATALLRHNDEDGIEDWNRCETCIDRVTAELTQWQERVAGLETQRNDLVDRVQRDHAVARTNASDVVRLQGEVSGCFREHQLTIASWKNTIAERDTARTKLAKAVELLQAYHVGATTDWFQARDAFLAGL